MLVTTDEKLDAFEMWYWVKDKESDWYKYWLLLRAIIEWVEKQ